MDYKETRELIEDIVDKSVGRYASSTNTFISQEMEAVGLKIENLKETVLTQNSRIGKSEDCIEDIRLRLADRILQEQVTNAARKGTCPHKEEIDELVQNRFIAMGKKQIIAYIAVIVIGSGIAWNIIEYLLTDIGLGFFG